MLKSMMQNYIPQIRLGAENRSAADFLCALLLALAPLLQHYRGIGPVDAGDGILLLCAPYLAYRFFKNLKSLDFRDLLPVLPLFVYYLYRVIDHGTGPKELAEALATCGYFAMAALGCINMRYLAISSFLVAMAASLCILLQYVCFYLFGFHLQLVCTELLRPASEQWILCAQTGLAGITGVIQHLYRPSAFFLEPSHMFLYFIPHLFLLLLSPERKTWKWLCALLLSLGLTFSTSGMGILVVIGVWALFVGCSSGKDNDIRLRNVFRRDRILICLALLAVFIVLCFTVPFLRESMVRIFGSDGTAISGRVARTQKRIQQMQGIQWIFGVSDSTAALAGNISGFHGALYKYGVIGLVLSYAVYLRGAIELEAHYRWMALILLLVSYFSTHTHSTFYMLYFTFFLLDGIVSRRKRGARGLAPL